MPNRISRVNRVTLLGALIGLLTLAPVIGPSWLLLKANRLVAGDVYGAFALSGGLAFVLLGVWISLLGSSLFRYRGRAWVGALLTAAALVVTVLLIGGGADGLLASSSDPERARVSLQGGVWLTLLA